MRNQLTITLCPGKCLPLLPQQAAESVTQTTQQVLSQALAEQSFCTRPSSFLGRGRGTLLQRLLFQGQPEDEMKQKGLRREPMGGNEVLLPLTVDTTLTYVTSGSGQSVPLPLQLPGHSFGTEWHLLSDDGRVYPQVWIPGA